MADKRKELSRLLEVFRKGLIDEQALVEQMAELGLVAGEHGEAEAALSSKSNLLGRLDEYRAAEASGAETLARWAELTDDPVLAGGLRTAAAREAAHAGLLASRLTELGGEPSATVPDWLSGYNAALLDPEASDEDRLVAILAQFPDVEAALEPLRREIAALQGDELTRELLRTICEDEALTLRWFHQLRSRNGVR